MEPAISIKGLTKFYRDLRALGNFSMKMEEGEFFGFLGPNGAGKTITINIIAGLTTYKEGEVKVFGKDIVRDYREASTPPSRNFLVEDSVQIPIVNSLNGAQLGTDLIVNLGVPVKRIGAGKLTLA